MITPASDCALLVCFGETLSEEFHPKVRALVRLLKKRDDLFLREIQPAYASVLLTFDPRKIDLKKLTAALLSILSKIEKQKSQGRLLNTRRIEIPVCYQTPLAPDLEDVAKHAGLSTEEVIHIHSATEYRVCFFGFMPGFSYWSGLSERLAVPRLPSPRLKVPAGSVGIGGSQTGIYPLETPGGWRIVGRTPIALFDHLRKPLCVLQLGDRVRLKPVSLREFEEFEGGKGVGETWEG